MKKEIKYSLIGSLISLVIYILITLISQITFTKDIFCVPCAIGLFFINFLPIYILKIDGWKIYLVSSIFYFLLGVVIGFLVWKFKK